MGMFALTVWLLIYFIFFWTCEKQKPCQQMPGFFMLMNNIGQGFCLVLFLSDPRLFKDYISWNTPQCYMLKGLLL